MNLFLLRIQIKNNFFFGGGGGGGGGEGGFGGGWREGAGVSELYFLSTQI